MATLTKINLAGEETGEIEIADSLLSSPYNPELAHAAAVAQLAARRSGTASTLTKGEVKATGSKPWRQKGTGRARAGYRASPIWRGGGVVFGPKPRDYGKKVSRRDRKAAFFGVLAEKLRENKVRVLETWELETPKTKIIALLKKNLGSRKLLCVGDAKDLNARLASRNVADTSFVDGGSLNVLDLITHDDVILSETALRALENRCEENAKNS